jgi:hypothetical protein
MLTFKQNQILAFDARLNLINSIIKPTSSFNVVAKRTRAVSCMQTKPEIAYNNISMIEYENNLLYDTILKIASPLDIIAFKVKNDGNSSKFAEETPNNEFSHIGIIVTRDILPNIKALVPGKLYVWEPFVVYNIASHLINQGGIMIRDLEKLHMKDFNLLYGQLSSNPWKIRTFDAKTTLKDQRLFIINKFKELHKTCDKNPKILSRSHAKKSSIFFHRNSYKNKHQLDDGIVFSVGLPADDGFGKVVFSSEMITTMYKKVGLLPKNVNPKTSTACDFFDGEHCFIIKKSWNIKNGK